MRDGAVLTIFALLRLVCVDNQGQTPLRPVAVCDVLRDLQAFSGKTVALIGRSTGTEEGWWLDEDCPRKLKTGDFEWRDMAWLQIDNSSESAFAGRMVIDSLSLRAKLTEIRNRTELRSTKETWAIVYGKVDARDKLETATYSTGQIVSNGFGHLNGAPFQLVYRKGDVRLLSEEEVQAILRGRPTKGATSPKPPNTD